jgi:drug/metabolite transporter (DMT)-like permease
VGVAASWIQLGERPTTMEAAGMTLIIAALALLAAYGVAVGRRAASALGDEATIPPVID